MAEDKVVTVEEVVEVVETTAKTGDLWIVVAADADVYKTGAGYGNSDILGSVAVGTLFSVAEVNEKGGYVRLVDEGEEVAQERYGHPLIKRFIKIRTLPKHSCTKFVNIRPATAEEIAKWDGEESYSVSCVYNRACCPTREHRISDYLKILPKLGLIVLPIYAIINGPCDAIPNLRGYLIALGACQIMDVIIGFLFYLPTMPEEEARLTGIRRIANICHYLVLLSTMVLPLWGASLVYPNTWCEDNDHYVKSTGYCYLDGSEMENVDGALRCKRQTFFSAFLTTIILNVILFFIIIYIIYMIATAKKEDKKEGEEMASTTVSV